VKDTFKDSSDDLQRVLHIFVDKDQAPLILVDGVKNKEIVRSFGATADVRFVRSISSTKHHMSLKKR